MHHIHLGLGREMGVECAYAETELLSGECILPFCMQWRRGDRGMKAWVQEDHTHHDVMHGSEGGAAGSRKLRQLTFWVLHTVPGSEQE